MVGILLFTPVLRSEIAPVVPAPALTSPEIAVDAGPRGQYQPSVDGDLVAYTNETAAMSNVGYADLATGDRGTTDGAFDFWTDVNARRIVFTRAAGSRIAIMLLTLSTGTVAEVDPAPAGVNRHGAAIGGNTIAWVDLGTAPDLSSSEIHVRDLATSTTIRLTDDDRMDAAVRVSPDGKVITWTSCLTNRGDDCNVMQAVATGAGWVKSALTGAGESEYLTATDGTLVAYDIFGPPPGADIFWQPVGGGVEWHLDLPGTQVWPSMSDGVIAFESGEVGRRDIWAYDTKTSFLYRVTDDPADDTIADIDVAGNVATVVWNRLVTDNDVYARRFELLRPVSVKQKLEELRGRIAASGNHLATALGAKLSAAARALEAENTTAACRAMLDFLNQIAAQRGKKIPPTDADEWGARAEEIRVELGCS